MTVSFDLRPSDHWALNRYVMTHDFRTGGAMLIALLFVPGMLFASSLRDGKSLQSAAGAAAAVVAMAVVVGYPVFRLMAWSRFRALPAHLRTQEMTLEDAGVRIVTPKVNQVIKWAAIRDVRRDRKAIYLFLSRRAALIVPLRAFPSGSDASAFVSAARSHASR